MEQLPVGTREAVSQKCILRSKNKILYTKSNEAHQSLFKKNDDNSLEGLEALQ